MITQKQLELAIIRCAERWPDRVGLKYRTWNEDHSDHCIFGQIVCDIAGCGKTAALDGVGPSPLLSAAINMNNAGVRWGDMPRLLGLVQGEEADAPNSTVAQGARALEPAAHNDWSQPIPEEVTA